MLELTKLLWMTGMRIVPWQCTSRGCKFRAANSGLDPRALVWNCIPCERDGRTARACDTGEDRLVSGERRFSVTDATRRDPINCTKRSVPRSQPFPRVPTRAQRRDGNGDDRRRRRRWEFSPSHDISGNRLNDDNIWSFLTCRHFPCCDR